MTKVTTEKEGAATLPPNEGKPKPDEDSTDGSRPSPQTKDKTSPDESNSNTAKRGTFSVGDPQAHVSNQRHEVGAFSVDGPQAHASNESVGSINDDIEDPEAATPANDGKPAMYDMAVDAYPVPDEKVTGVPIQTGRNLCLVISAVVFVALAVGIPVGIANGKKEESSSLEDPDAIVFQSIPFKEYYQFDVKRFKHTDENGNSAYTTIGSVDYSACEPLACMASDEHCKALGAEGESGNVLYEYPCCAGPDCPLEEKCGEICSIAVHCEKTREDCFSSACYECQKDENGEDLFYFKASRTAIDCLEVGTKTSPDGIEYNWAIMCGPQESGGAVEENRAPGEYQCTAARKSVEGYHPSIDDMNFASIPCQYIQLAECGCGPLDMFDFGLGMPTETCRTEDDCQFLCGDVPDKAKNLCFAFGGIDWWEGGNKWGVDILNSPELPHNNKNLQILIN